MRVRDYEAVLGALCDQEYHTWRYDVLNSRGYWYFVDPTVLHSHRQEPIGETIVCDYDEHDTLVGFEVLGLVGWWQPSHDGSSLTSVTTYGRMKERAERAGESGRRTVQRFGDALDRLGKS